MEQEIPEVSFDEERAFRIFPRPNLKHSVLVPIPETAEGNEIPTFIKPEWGGIQVFYGDYYAIVVDGNVVYGSAKLQWRQMHTEITPGYWVKTATPMAYRATEPCCIVTLIPSADGGIKETKKVLEPGDWIVRQPGGEVQHVKAANYDGIYFMQMEADELGLTAMSGEDFADWAVSQVRQLVPTA